MPESNFLEFYQHSRISYYSYKIIHSAPPFEHIKSHKTNQPVSRAYILGDPKLLVYTCNALAAILGFITEEDWEE